MFCANLITKIYRFEQINKNKPTAIHKQITELKNWYGFSLSNSRIIKEISRIEFYGIYVYEVDEDNHIGIG